MMRYHLLTCLAAFMALLVAGPVGSAHAQDVVPGTRADFETNIPTVVFFDFDRDEIRSDMAPRLDQQASWLLAYPDVEVDLAGHTDAVGANAYNQDLGLRRANAVRDYLVARGIAPDRMRSVISFGEDDLMVDTLTAEERNRRVVTVVTREMPTPVAQCAPGALLAVGSMGDLREALTARIDRSVFVFDTVRAGRQGGDLELFTRSGLSKVRCSIAYGFAQNSIRDEYWLGECECNYDIMEQLASNSGI